MASQNESFTGRAIVTRGPHKQGKWALEQINLRPLKEYELLVQMVASGICHTDVVFGDNAEALGIGGWPRVMGHEGSGYVKDVGPHVTVAEPGDPVLLSFSSCRTCRICRSGQLSHCTSFNRINFNGQKCFSTRSVSSSAEECDIAGSFFGQSSFASLSIVSEASVVNAKELVEGVEELRLFAPLGCGIQTGAGTVVNVAKASAEDTVCVIGLGGVGLSAVMGAALCGCRTIIGIDRVASRLEIAKELGCSHVIDTGGMKDLGDVVEEVRKITDGYGTSVTVDTTGLQKLIETGVEFTSNRGQYIQVGSTMPDQKIQIPIQKFMGDGKRFIGAVEGQVIPNEFVPRMISWYREGRFPVDRLVKLFRAEDFASALEEMHDGSTIKPVITWT